MRIFSKSPERQAEPEAIQAFEDSVKSSSIPAQQIGDVNKEKLPGPEFLTQKSGTKEGQVVMIHETDGSVTAHQWSQSNRQWVSVGTVVDAVGSTGKKKDFYGKEYDYVFDVDIEDGKPPLKLPYNLSQNPYEAATKFIEDNELPIGYLDQVANFITTNTQGSTIGQSSQPSPPAPPGADPWGSESRYRPGESTSAPQPVSQPPKSQIIPQTQYLSIKTATLTTIEKKIRELDDQLIKEGSKDIALNPSQMTTLHALIQALDQEPPLQAETDSIITDAIPVILLMLTSWPAAQQLPSLDLLRLLIAASSSGAKYKTPSGDSIIDVLASSGVFQDKERSNNIMLAVRAFVNLFETKDGHDLADSSFDQIHTLVQSASSTTNRNLAAAVATLYINYAVLLCTTASRGGAELPASVDRGLLLMDDLTKMIGGATDSEVMYRSLVAAGTLLTLGEEVLVAAKEVYGLGGALERIERGFREPRIKDVVAEIRVILG